MPITIEEIELAPDAEDISLDAESGMPPIFGRCPVCKKPLFPRNKRTGEMQAPPVGKGYESRAKCGGCGAIIYYAGNGNWHVLTNDDLTPEDAEADTAGRD